MDYCESRNPLTRCSDEIFGYCDLILFGFDNINIKHWPKYSDDVNDFKRIVGDI